MATAGHIADQTSGDRVLKYYTVTLGNTLGHDPGIVKKFHELIPGLNNVLNSEKCDFILVFLHFDLQAGTDIKEAVKILNALSDDKPAILMVLHHKSDLKTTVPDSRGAVNRKNTITVDLLYCKEMGLLRCYKNDEALCEVINYINPENILNIGPRQSQTHEQMVKNPHPKYFTLATGNTLGHHVSLEGKLQELIPGLQKVQNLDECDFILVFCPFVSRAETDIEAAVKKLNILPGNRPTVLVVLHHNPESVVPESSRRVHRENTVTVDCLFHEGQGLLHCSINDEALSKVINWLQSEGILSNPAKQNPNQDSTANQRLMLPHKKYFTVVIGNTFARDVGLEGKFEELIEGLQKVQKLEECDFILVFCLFDSRCGTDIEPALNMLSGLPGNKAAIVLVLHYTSDPNTIVPDSSEAVNRKNTITVDVLFCKDVGLLTCCKNDEALCKVINWINNADITNMGPRQSQNQDTTANQMLMHRHKKYFTVVTGNTFARDVGLERKLEELIEGLQKVQKLEECDFILVFCLFDSQCGTDIKPSLNMLSSLPANKPAVVLVLHHTSDPNTIVPDSRGAVNRKNTITVDVLFCKDVGLLTCCKNDEALCKVINWINNADITNMGPRQSQTDEHITNQLVKNQHPKYFTLLSGNTLGHHVSIERKLQELIPGLQKVQDLEECDFSLVFCPVVSRTDTEAAVKKLSTLPGNRPTVLVVLHHTFDPESVVPDSSRRVNRENTVTVDCLFYEDQGLLQCSKNDEALSKVINWLYIEGILTKPAKQTQSITTDKGIKNWFSSWGTWTKQENKQSHQNHTVHQLLKRHPLKHYSLNTGKTLGHDIGIERKLEELVPSLQKVQKLEECDFILVFCPIVSRAGTDIEAAMRELSSLSGTKPAALMVLHHTFDPEQIVPDSKMTVKRDHLITVDCLFHEDHGLLRCNKNNEACILVSDWIKAQVLPMTKKGNKFN
ncbi:verrucotoxin subunit beta-like isoform X6, partial [Clarias magur]